MRKRRLRLRRRSLPSRWMGLASLATAFAAMPVAATENGATNKIPGSDTVLIGVMPPPGTLLSTSFLAAYTANKTVNSSGDPRTGISNFKVDVLGVATRLGYVWPNAQFLGADVETRIGVGPYANINISFDAQTPGGPVHQESGAGTSFPAVALLPIILGWHNGGLHQEATVQAFVSTREYRTGQIANIATGFNSLAPSYWVTWFPTPDIEIDGAFAYLFNGTNHQTGYKSGQEISIDYGAGYALNSNWQLGINGYAYRQTTDDTLKGNTFADGNRGEVFAIGPYIRYHVDPKFAITFKWQNEVFAENRSQGNRFFLHFGFKL